MAGIKQYTAILKLQFTSMLKQVRNKEESNLYKDKYSVKGHLFNRKLTIGFFSLHENLLHACVKSYIMWLQCVMWTLVLGPYLSQFFVCLQHENLGSNSQLKFLWCKSPTEVQQNNPKSESKHRSVSAVSTNAMCMFSFVYHSVAANTLSK